MIQPIEGYETKDKTHSYGQLNRDEAYGILRDYKTEIDRTMDQLPGNSKESPCIMTSCPLVDDYRIDEASFGSAICVVAIEGGHDDIYSCDENIFSQHNVDWIKHKNLLFEMYAD